MAMDARLAQSLQQGIAQMGLAISAEQQEKLLAYLALLIKWNKAYNLTAVREPQEMISRHLLDSLSILPYVRDEAIIDVGSGAGLPGIPLAICRPQLAVTTLDSNGKKTRFQLQAKLALGLDNLTVVHERLENYRTEPYPQVVSRAFASLQDMIHWTGDLCRPDGIFLAMKGQYPQAELDNLPNGYALKQSYPLQVPDTDGERHLLIIGSV